MKSISVKEGGKEVEIELPYTCPRLAVFSCSLLTFFLHSALCLFTLSPTAAKLKIPSSSINNQNNGGLTKNHPVPNCKKDLQACGK